MQLSDLIYFLYLDLNEINLEFLNELLKGDEQKFRTFVHHHFFNDYQKEVFERVGLNYHEDFPQDQIDVVFKEFAIFFHDNINPSYLKSRGITDEQIIKFSLGSTHGLRNEDLVDELIHDLLIYFPKELISRVLDFHQEMAFSNQKYFGDPYCSTIPSMDSSGNCKGIAYRTEKYKKKNEWRNLHKFFVSHAPSYVFNQKTIDETDELILVEGVFDVLSLDRLDITNAVSMSHTRMSKYQYELLKSKKITAIYDRDKGGLFGIKAIEENYDFPKFSPFLVPKDDVDLLVRNEPKEFLKFYHDTVLSSISQ